MIDPKKSLFIGVREGRHTAVMVEEEKITRSVLDHLPAEWPMRRARVNWAEVSVATVVTAYAILYAVSGDKALCDTWAADFAADVICKLPYAGFELEGKDVFDAVRKCRACEAIGEQPRLIAIDGSMTFPE